MKLTRLLIILALLAASCGSDTASVDTEAMPTTSEAIPESATTAADEASATEAGLADVGIALPAADFGAVASNREELVVEKNDLPDEFEILVSLFELDGSLVIGFSPFEDRGRNCLEARFSNAGGRPRAYSAPISAGTGCETFSPFLLADTDDDLVICSDVYFLRTDADLESLSAEGSTMLAAVTAPHSVSGVVWIGATFTGPISPEQIPDVDLSERDCDVQAELALDPDVPPHVEGLPQQLSIDPADDEGIRVNYSALGEGVEFMLGVYRPELSNWGEIVVDDDTRLEALHDDGRYLAYVPTGGPGPMRVSLCVWASVPDDAACAP